jgi:hypothetical protein
MKIIFSIVASLFCSLAYCQEQVIYWNESVPLKWKYFSGKVKDTSAFDAEVFAEVRYTYEFFSTGDYRFDVYAQVDPQTSWCKGAKQSADLLKHEQLHFDIAELFARRIKQAFENYQYTENFSSEIEQIFNQKKAEYHAVQRQYDEETNHSIDKEKQRSWQQQVQNELSKTKPSNFSTAKR